MRPNHSTFSVGPLDVEIDSYSLAYLNEEEWHDQETTTYDQSVDEMMQDKSFQAWTYHDAGESKEEVLQRYFTFFF